MQETKPQNNVRRASFSNRPTFVQSQSCHDDMARYVNFTGASNHSIKHIKFHWLSNYFSLGWIFPFYYFALH